MKVYCFTVYKDNEPVDYFGGIEANDLGFATSLFREKAGLSTFCVSSRKRPKYFVNNQLAGITWTHTVRDLGI